MSEVKSGGKELISWTSLLTSSISANIQEVELQDQEMLRPQGDIIWQHKGKTFTNR